MKKGTYLGGSTVIRNGSNWFGKSDRPPETWGGETDERFWSRAKQLHEAPPMRNREEILAERAAKRLAAKAARREANSAKEKLSREQKILGKYEHMTASLFKQK